jgi:hypothetical protein
MRSRAYVAHQQSKGLQFETFLRFQCTLVQLLAFCINLMQAASGKTGVLFVCLGNICRSPTAEAVFNDVVKRAGVADGYFIDSCGTGGGNPDWYRDGGWSYHEGALTIDEVDTLVDIVQVSAVLWQVHLRHVIEHIYERMRFLDVYYNRMPCYDQILIDFSEVTSASYFCAILLAHARGPSE